RPTLQPDPRQGDPLVEIGRLGGREGSLLAPGGLGVRLDARYLEPVGDGAETDPEYERLSVLRRLRQLPALAEVASRLLEVRVGAAVVLVVEARPRIPRRIELH